MVFLAVRAVFDVLFLPAGAQQGMRSGKTPINHPTGSFL